MEEAWTNKEDGIIPMPQHGYTAGQAGSSREPAVAILPERDQPRDCEEDGPHGQVQAPLHLRARAGARYCAVLSSGGVRL
jgi:hypothetical protein